MASIKLKQKILGVPAGAVGCRNPDDICVHTKNVWVLWQGGFCQHHSAVNVVSYVLMYQGYRPPCFWWACYRGRGEAQRHRLLFNFDLQELIMSWALLTPQAPSCCTMHQSSSLCFGRCVYAQRMSYVHGVQSSVLQQLPAPSAVFTKYFVSSVLVRCMSYQFVCKDGMERVLCCLFRGCGIFFWLRPR